MREALAPHENKRLTFTGTFARFGKRRGWQGREEATVLLRDITNGAGEVVTDHLWFRLTAQFARLDLQEGDVVRFGARVTRYRKGYRGRREDMYVMDKPPAIDFQLSRPTRVEKVTEEKGQLPLLPEGAKERDE